MDFGSPALSPRVDNDLQIAAFHDVDKLGDETALKREINVKTASEIMSNSTEIDAQKVWMGNKDQKKIAISDPPDAFVATTSISQGTRLHYRRDKHKDCVTVGYYVRFHRN
jgi:hypothetical protein